ncbi:MAG: hypothetical protein LBC40_09470 [Dysgonamonadaceae bacterium]|jgi:hypothetical protein|nr:hypothetical protein [Dysgonamonadaceae bacterium]
MSSTYLPNNDREFLSWVINFLKQLSQSLARFTFPADEYQKLSAQRTDFSQKLEIAEEPSTRTKPSVLAKNISRKLLEKTIQQDVKEFLMFNRNVTDEDREDLGLPIYKTTRTPSAVAKDAPDVDVDSSIIGRLIFHFFEKGNSHKRGKPDGQHCAEIAWVLSDTPPVRWEELIHSAVDTNSPFTLQFENDQRGKTVYFALRWENTRGEKGPWSQIYSAIIP